MGAEVMVGGEVGWERLVAGTVVVVGPPDHLVGRLGTVEAAVVGLWAVELMGEGGKSAAGWWVVAVMEWGVKVVVDVEVGALVAGALVGGAKAEGKTEAMVGVQVVAAGLVVAVLRVAGLVGRMAVMVEAALAAIAAGVMVVEVMVVEAWVVEEEAAEVMVVVESAVVAPVEGRLVEVDWVVAAMGGARLVADTAVVVALLGHQAEQWGMAEATTGVGVRVEGMKVASAMVVGCSAAVVMEMGAKVAVDSVAAELAVVASVVAAKVMGAQVVGRMVVAVLAAVVKAEHLIQRRPYNLESSLHMLASRPPPRSAREPGLCLPERSR